MKLDKKAPPPDPRMTLARDIEILTTQWSWKWTSKAFEPERYNFNGDTCHDLKVTLLRSARERDKNNPKLSRGDLSNALKHFGLETRKEKKQQSSSADKGEDCKSPKSKPSSQPEGMESEASVQPQPEEPSETVERPEAHVRESVETEMQIDSDESVHEPVTENATESNSNSLRKAPTENSKPYALKIFRAREAEIIESLAFVKQTLEQQNVDPETDEYRRILLNHTSRLQHCETTIRNVQKEIEEEFQKATHREIEIRGQLEKEYAEFQELQEKERGICRNVQYYSFIASLLRVGPLGLDSLLFKLRYSGVDVVGEVNKNSSNAVQDHVMT
ncbi:hypothetical protein FVER53590_12752 [Fusarium verticillioides]|nr:hypothetical protein FVER53590_12752 [Fusarium verticillioides]